MMMKREVTIRQKIGFRAGVVGVGTNLMLFGGKFVMGMISGSVAVMTDSFNNLIDLVSSIVTMVGFRMSAKRGDAMHPHGHGRMEYVAGFVISMLIVATAVTFGQLAISRIINPVDVETSVVLFGILSVSILGKLGLAVYFRLVNEKIDSATLIASAKDSLSDALITSVTVIALLVAPVTSIPVDGIAGLAVAVFILVAGLTSFFENVSLLLGENVDTKISKKIRRIVLSKDAFAKVQLIEMHDYGPESRKVIVKVVLKKGVVAGKVEVDLMNAKTELKDKLDVDATIYWSPVFMKK